MAEYFVQLIVRMDALLLLLDRYKYLTRTLTMKASFSLQQKDTVLSQSLNSSHPSPSLIITTRYNYEYTFLSPRQQSIKRINHYEIPRPSRASRLGLDQLRPSLSRRLERLEQCFDPGRCHRYRFQVHYNPLSFQHRRRQCHSPNPDW